MGKWPCTTTAGGPATAVCTPSLRHKGLLERVQMMACAVCQGLLLAVWGFRAERQLKSGLWERRAGVQGNQLRTITDTHTAPLAFTNETAIWWKEVLGCKNKKKQIPSRYVHSKLEATPLKWAHTARKRTPLRTSGAMAGGCWVLPAHGISYRPVWVKEVGQTGTVARHDTPNGHKWCDDRSPFKPFPPVPDHDPNGVPQEQHRLRCGREESGAVWCVQAPNAKHRLRFGGEGGGMGGSYAGALSRASWGTPFPRGGAAWARSLLIEGVPERPRPPPPPVPRRMVQGRAPSSPSGRGGGGGGGGGYGLVGHGRAKVLSALFVVTASCAPVP